jgi:hypothetical protein
LLTVGSQKKKKEEKKKKLKRNMATKTRNENNVGFLFARQLFHCRTNSEKKKKNERNIKILRDGTLFQL